jgi:chromosome segregation protein
MYLKKITLFGFKSFGDKAELFFEPGVTSIVGPNGCGKSNISDSIRWVLGEDNVRELRGERMEDLIFNGTGQRKGVGFAEVALTFDNATRFLPVDFSEVEISRKAYRSGESEYMINRMPCRLRDIRDLLMDTGIGVDSYSVVGQGKMDRILSSKPQDRREIFEEASGIMKYKVRKREAANKLDRTEENILRINDIIQEVKRQINSLTRQTQKAKAYTSKQNQLQELEIQKGTFELKQIRQSGGIKKEERERLVLEQNDLTAKIKEAEAELAESKQLFETEEKQFSTSRIELSEVTAERKGLEDRRRMNFEWIQEIEQTHEGLLHEIEDLNKRKGEIEQKIQAGEKALKEEEENQKKWAQEKQEKNQRVTGIAHRIETRETDIDEEKQRILDLAGQIAHQRNDYARLTAELEGKQARQKRLEVEREREEREQKIALVALSEGKQTQDRIEQELNRIRGSQNELHNKLGTTESLRAQVHSDWVDKRETHSKIASKKEFLLQLEARHEGFSSGVRAILEETSKETSELEGVMGVLANLIRVEKGYERVVEKALGEDVQIVICRTRKDAEQANQFLNHRKAGRARFFSLDTVANKRNTRAPAGWTSVLAYIHADAAIQPLLYTLLSQAWSGGSMEEAWSARRGYADPISRWVTQSGEVIWGDGCLEGGAFKGDFDHSLIARRSQIEELASQSSNLSGQLNDMAHQEKVLADKIQQNKDQLHQTEESLREKELESANLNNELTTRGGVLKRLEEKLEILSLDISDNATDIDELKTRERQVQQALETLVQEDRSLQTSVLGAQNDINEVKKEREQLLVELAQLEMSVTHHISRVQSQQSGLEDLKTQLNQQGETLSNRKKRISSLLKRKEELNEENQSIDSNREQWSKKIEALEIKIEQAMGRRDHAQQEIAGQEKVLFDHSRALEENRNQIRDFDVHQTQFRYQQDSIRDRIQQAYHVDIYETKIEVPANFDLAGTHTLINRLQMQIEKMGQVNLVAMDEQKELEDRLNFLIDQKEDLVKAKASIHQAINKINKTTRTLFIETFEKIQEWFKDYFQILFGGGTVELVLLDEKDCLESGIDILVKPTGKKMRNITLLSGGERALTATALMFALFKVRPSPFCVLDEIDAPLDEANINRFTQVLEDFVKDSQFIVITHNKRTISISDNIYGVTMEESGVSKVVSIKLKRDQREETKEPSKKEGAVLNQQ